MWQEPFCTTFPPNPKGGWLCPISQTALIHPLRENEPAPYSVESGTEWHILAMSRLLGGEFLSCVRAYKRRVPEQLLTYIWYHRFITSPKWMAEKNNMLRMKSTSIPNVVADFMKNVNSELYLCQLECSPLNRKSTKRTKKTLASIRLL